MLSKPWHENVKLWHPKCHSAASYEVSARPRSIYTCQNVHVIKLPCKVKLNSPWSWFYGVFYEWVLGPCRAFVFQGVWTHECGKNISRSVLVSGQDLHICPSDKGKMENFHQTLNAAEWQQPKAENPWSPALLLSNNARFRAKIDTNYYL